MSLHKRHVLFWIYFEWRLYVKMCGFCVRVCVCVSVVFTSFLCGVVYVFGYIHRIESRVAE